MPKLFDEHPPIHPLLPTSIYWENILDSILKYASISNISNMQTLIFFIWMFWTYAGMALVWILGTQYFITLHFCILEKWSTSVTCCNDYGVPNLTFLMESSKKESLLPNMFCWKFNCIWPLLFTLMWSSPWKSGQCL